VSAGAVGKEIQLLLLDAVFHIPAGAVKVLVRSGRDKPICAPIVFETFRWQIGHDKAWIIPFEQNLRFADDPPGPTPSLQRRIIKLHETAAGHLERSLVDLLLQALKFALQRLTSRNGKNRTLSR